MGCHLAFKFQSIGHELSVNQVHLKCLRHSKWPGLKINVARSFATQADVWRNDGGILYV